jgi:hypothetical protein
MLASRIASQVFKMFRLKKDNVERVVASKAICDFLVSKGFTIIKDTTETDKSNSLSLEEMTIDELKAYAKEKDIDIGKATSLNGILEKINEAQD